MLKKPRQMKSARLCRLPCGKELYLTGSTHLVSRGYASSYGQREPCVCSQVRNEGLPPFCDWLPKSMRIILRLRYWQKVHNFFLSGSSATKSGGKPSFLT